MSLRNIMLSSKEEDSQKYLENNPQILLSAFANRWAVNEIIPKFKFGTEFISDFVVVSGQSWSYDIYLIELEPPTASPFNKDGTYSQRLNGAMKQINEWLDWVRINEAYFRRSLASKMNDYYGKSQIYDEPRILDDYRRFFIHSKIIIGCRNHLTKKDNRSRATIRSMHNNQLEIIPYDRLAEIEESESYQKDVN